MRKIAVITGTRAEYGLLFWIINGIHEDPQLELQLIVTGMHLSPEFGLTVKEIEKDGFPIAEKVEMLLSSDTETSIAISMGLGMIGFSKAYERLRPNILVVLGDRFELFAAVGAAIPFRIPVAHISGGETTVGVIDEAIRHSITKMSHVHFVSTEKYKKRVIQMGESPNNIFCVGAPALDNIYKLNLLNREELWCKLDLPQNKKIGVVTYHPVTLEKDTCIIQISELLMALEGFLDVFWVFTAANADTEGRVIMRKIDEFVKKNPEKNKIFISLGQLKYLSLLKHTSVMVGNSSSGIVEAASFELPVVNIGERQEGRIRTKNIIDVPKCDRKAIEHGIEKALSKEFRNSLQGMQSPYGDGSASERIIKELKEISLCENLLKKKFYDIQ